VGCSNRVESIERRGTERDSNEEPGSVVNMNCGRSDGWSTCKHQ